MEGVDGFTVATRYWHALPDGRLQCDLCPRDCRLHEGQRGFCFVRAARGQSRSCSPRYGRSSGFCVDPIEKKPLNHFLPGHELLSFGTAGLQPGLPVLPELGHLQVARGDTLADDASPETIADAAMRARLPLRRLHLQRPGHLRASSPSTWPGGRERGLQVRGRDRRLRLRRTRGAESSRTWTPPTWISRPSPRTSTASCAAQLAPVLDTLVYLAHETDVWLEITTLLIPGLNDSEARSRLAVWIVEHLGPDVPLHFTAFHPDFKMNDLPPTRPRRSPGPAASRWRRAAPRLHRQRARHEGGTTFCPGCAALRSSATGTSFSSTASAARALRRPAAPAPPGLFEGSPGTWGRRRRPVQIPGLVSVKPPGEGPSEREGPTTW